MQDEAPSSITYPGSPYTFTKNDPVSGVTPTYTGGAPTSWMITNGVIPNGLSLHPSTGEIIGTPLDVTTSTVTLTIRASNPAGFITTTVDIDVQDEAPSSIAYPGSPYTFTKNDAVTGATPTYTAGAPTSWAITAGTIPAGLSVDSSTGEIIGTPTTVTTSTVTLTIEASNAAGSASTTVDIDVQDEAPSSITYPGSPYTFTKNDAVTGATPTYTGGAPTSWMITNGVIPNGLSLHPSTGEIIGTPLDVTTSTVTLTIRASNPAGFITTTVDIDVQDEAPSITYPGSPFTFTKNTAVSGVIPTNVGGVIDTWSMTGTLPNGLTFNNLNGEITGTPLDVTPTSVTVTITATNSADSSVTTVEIFVQDEAPSITYPGSPFTFTKNTAVSGVIPTNSGGVIDTWSMTGTLPNGLSFNNLNGEITGTPLDVTPTSVTVTITATNSADSSVTTVEMFVQDEAPSITYPGSPFTFTKNTAVSGVIPTNSGGVIDTWSMTGTLPNGLNFNNLNGEITGTPLDVTISTVFLTIEASNSAGDSSIIIEINVQDLVPDIAYIPDDITLLNDSSILNMIPISTGGQIGSWSISPEPSTGLTFDTLTGIFSGTPTETKVRTEYQITATNGVGVDVVKVNITIEEFDYSLPLSPIYLLENTEMQSIEPTSTIPGAVYETSPQLPDGVFIGENNGTIWGTPTDGYPLTPFTIYANSSLLNSIVEIQIGVLDDSDGDGMPNQLPNDYDTAGVLVEDTDDDGDSFSDVREIECGTDHLDATSVVTDLDGDSICDALDDDMDGDGLLNDEETNTGNFDNEFDSLTDPANPDADGDGVCDGPATPDSSICVAGPDAFPNDPSAQTDTDGDGMPDEINGVSTSPATTNS